MTGTVTSILGNEQLIGLLGIVITGVWSLVQTTGWWQRLKDSKWNKAIECLRDGAEIAYETYVKEIKAASENGLTDDEAARARTVAINAAIALGKSRGVDILKVVGSEYLNHWLESIVAKLKKQARVNETVAAKMEGLGL